MARNANEIKLLLVDDEDSFRSTLAKRLDHRGFVIRQAENAQQALEGLREEPVDVVLMDVKMPGVSGLETLPKIKQNWPDVEVILLTGQACVNDGVCGIKEGAFDYLTKPVEIDHLVSKLHQAVDMRDLLREQELEAQFRREMERRMSVAERLAALGTMASGVAHEINNPLAIIGEAAGWLQGRVGREKGLGEDFRKAADLALAKINSSVERAARITHQLLDFARKNDWEIQEFDVVELVREVIELTENTAKETQGKVELRAGASPLVMWSDPYQLRQVLINLINNALQAVGQIGGGSVWVSVDLAGDDVFIAVKDTGPGIPKENLRRVFEPFFSTKPAGKGTGLGLSVSKGIVEKLGGTIEVDSRVGRGAAFRVSLPRRPVVSPVRPEHGPEL